RVSACSTGVERGRVRLIAVLDAGGARRPAEVADVAPEQDVDEQEDEAEAPAAHRQASAHGAAAARVLDLRGIERRVRIEGHGHLWGSDRASLQSAVSRVAAARTSPADNSQNRCEGAGA